VSHLTRSAESLLNYSLQIKGKYTHFLLRSESNDLHGTIYDKTFAESLVVSFDSSN
jgi:hypothetical protein